jgi:hypothetical protein
MATTKGLENINELIRSQAQLYSDVLAGKVDHQAAKTACAAAGTIIAACKLQLEYSMQRQEQPVIDFLGGEMSPIEVKYHNARKQLMPAKEGDEA